MEPLSKHLKVKASPIVKYIIRLTQFKTKNSRVYKIYNNWYPAFLFIRKILWFWWRSFRKSFQI